MKKEMKKVPVVRFKGFTSDWEQRKVSDEAEIITGGTPNTKIVEYWNPPEIPWLSSGEVNKKYITTTDKFISRLGLENSSAQFVTKNSVLIALAGQGKTRGTVAINRISLTTNQSIAAMIFKDNIYPDFVFSNLENRYEELRSISSGDGSRGGLNKKLIGDIVFPCPSFDEQKSIGDFFYDLNDLITLHQRKSDQLKKLKAYFLQNLFPAKGEKVPKIRFKGFTGEWEERKIGDCFDERKEGMPNGELLSVTINEGVKRFSELERHDSSNQDKSKYKKVCIGDIAYNSMRMWQGASGVSTYEGIVSPAYTILQPKDGINSKFVSYLFKKKDILYIFQVNSQGITSDNWNLKFPILSKISIRVPASIKEQNKIAKQMEKIDDIITLHQQKIAQLQAVKKFLLQNLFV